MSNFIDQPFIVEAHLFAYVEFLLVVQQEGARIVFVVENGFNHRFITTPLLIVSMQGFSGKKHQKKKRKQI
jgi:hypothetical protein